MARTLKNSGIATSLQFLFCVDDDNTTCKAFVSLNTSLSDNSAAVNSALTRDASVRTGTMSWNGNGSPKTVPYFDTGGGSPYTWFTFGATKPHIESNAGGLGTYVMIGTVPSISFVGCAPIMTADTSGPYMVEATHDGGTNWYAEWEQGGLTTLVQSTVNGFTKSANQTWAFVHNSGNGMTQRCYLASDGAALTQNNSSTSGSALNIYGDLGHIGGDGTAHWHDGKIIMLAFFTGEINSTDLAALHVDPFGTLFTTTAAASTPKLLTLGAG